MFPLRYTSASQRYKGRDSGSSLFLPSALDMVDDVSERYTYYFDIFKYHSNWKTIVPQSSFQSSLLPLQTLPAIVHKPRPSSRIPLLPDRGKKGAGFPGQFGYGSVIRGNRSLWRRSCCFYEQGAIPHIPSSLSARRPAKARLPLFFPDDSLFRFLYRRIWSPIAADT